MSAEILIPTHRLLVEKIKLNFIQNVSQIIDHHSRSDFIPRLNYNRVDGYTCQTQDDQLYIMWLKSQGVTQVDAIVDVDITSDKNRSQLITETQKQLDLGYVLLPKGTTLYRRRKVFSLAPYQDEGEKFVTLEPLKLMFLVSEITDELELVFGGQVVLSRHCKTVPTNRPEQYELLLNIVNTVYKFDGWVGSNTAIYLSPEIRLVLVPEVAVDFPAPVTSAPDLEASIATPEPTFPVTSFASTPAAICASISVGKDVKLDITSLPQKLDHNYNKLVGTDTYGKMESMFTLLMREIDPTALTKLWLARI